MFSDLSDLELQRPGSRQSSVLKLQSSMPVPNPYGPKDPLTLAYFTYLNLVNPDYQA
jgi:hypothetical protein